MTHHKFIFKIYMYRVWFSGKQPPPKMYFEKNQNLYYYCTLIEGGGLFPLLKAIPTQSFFPSQVKKKLNKFCVFNFWELTCWAILEKLLGTCSVQSVVFALRCRFNWELCLLFHWPTTPLLVLLSVCKTAFTEETPRQTSDCKLLISLFQTWTE